MLVVGETCSTHHQIDVSSVMMVDEEDTELPKEATDCLLGAPVFVLDENDAMGFVEAAVVGPQESKTYRQYPKHGWNQA